MKTVQIYNLHLVTGEVVQAAEDYELKGKKTIVSLFQRADDEDIFLITDLLLGSCYIPKKNIAYTPFTPFFTPNRIFTFTKQVGMV